MPIFSTVISKRISLNSPWFETSTDFSDLVSQLTESGDILERSIEESSDGYTQTINTKFKDIESYRNFSQSPVIKSSIQARQTHNLQNKIEFTVGVK